MEESKSYIQKKYGEVANQTSKKFENDADIIEILPLSVLSSSMNLGYSQSDLGEIPMSSNMGLGCGNPILNAELKEGETVLDLGSGGGIDCFLARRKVGDRGYVIGVDMTPEMIRLANHNKAKSGFSNIDFRLGQIENLPIESNSVDVIISNCVINLSSEKGKVFSEAYRVLKEKGRICVSDILATAALPDYILQDLAQLAGCVAGAEYVGTIHKMLEVAGFINIRITPKANSRQILKTWDPKNNLVDYVASFLIEATKK